MAIALDVATSSTAQTASPITWTHTVTSSGSNLLLVVGIAVGSGTTQPNVTAVTYGGVSMTKARGDQEAGTSTAKEETSIWLLHNPPTGANTVSATVTFGGSPRGAGISASYTGAQQSSTPDAVNGTSTQTYTSGVDVPINVTTIADNCWIFAVNHNQGTTGASVISDQTERGNLATFTANPFGRLAAEDTNAAQTPAGVKTVGFKPAFTGSARGYAMSAASFAPSVSLPKPFRPILQAVNRAATY